jgi:hypothetical protein
MKRSLFLQLPLVASALLANAHNSRADRAKKGFKVASGEDRYQEELLIMGGSFDCRCWCSSNLPAAWKTFSRK